MSLADKYAQACGYPGATAMLKTMDANAKGSPGISAAISLMVESSIIRALQVIEQSNDIEDGDSNERQ